MLTQATYTLHIAIAVAGSLASMATACYAVVRAHKSTGLQRCKLDNIQLLFFTASSVISTSFAVKHIIFLCPFQVVKKAILGFSYVSEMVANAELQKAAASQNFSGVTGHRSCPIFTVPTQIQEKSLE